MAAQGAFYITDDMTCYITPHNVAAQGASVRHSSAHVASRSQNSLGDGASRQEISRRHSVDRPRRPTLRAPHTVERVTRRFLPARSFARPRNRAMGFAPRTPDAPFPAAREFARPREPRAMG